MELYRLLLEAEEERVEFDLEETLESITPTTIRQQLLTASKLSPKLKAGAAILLILAGASMILGAITTVRSIKGDIEINRRLAKRARETGNVKSAEHWEREIESAKRTCIVVTAVGAIFGLLYLLTGVALWKAESMSAYDVAYILKEAKSDKPFSLQSIKNFIKKVWNKLVSFANKAYGWFKQKIGAKKAIIAAAFAAAGLALILYLKSKGHSVSEVYHTALETIKQGRAAKIVIGAAVMVVLALGAFFVFKTKGQEKKEEVKKEEEKKEK